MNVVPDNIVFRYTTGFIVCRIIMMNKLRSIYDAFLKQTNLYNEAKNYEKKEEHSRNFGKVKERFQESIEMQKQMHIDDVITKLFLKFEEGTITFGAKISKDNCVICEMTHTPA